MLRGKTNRYGHSYIYIKRAKSLRVLGASAFCLFLLLSLFAIFPIVKHTEDAEATFVPSTTSITIATGQETANVDITPISSNGTFNTSTNADLASFDVTTNNYTGYTLKLLGNDATGALTNTSYGTSLDTIAAVTSETDFRTGSASVYTNKWGIKPDTVNSAPNSDYLPAPTTTSEIPIETTNVANPTTANNHTVAVGARVDYTKPSGTYTNTFTLVAVGNPASFTITYDVGDVTDTITDMPANPTQGSTGDSYVTLDSAVPQRTGYTFAGWCNGTLSGTTANPGTTCTGTLITDGKFDLNQTASNTVPLHATWTANKYTCTKQWFLESESGTFSSTPSGTETESLDYNNTCTFQKTVTDYKGSTSSAGGVNTSITNGAQGSTTCTITTSGCTANLYFYRNTYTLTVNRNSTYISAASGGGAKMWGQSVPISATTSYSNFTKWTLTDASGSQISTAASTNYTMPKANTTIYANGDRPNMASFTKSTCSSRASSSNIWVYDARDNQYYTVRYINGGCWMTRNIAIGCNGSGGSYGSGRTTRSLTSSNSNVSTTWSTSSALSLDKTDGTSKCTNSDTSECNTFSTARMKCSTNYGAWYNYNAATTGYVTASTGTSATRDGQYSICPSGWRLPTQSEQAGIVNYKSAFSPVSGGRYWAGELGVNNYGYWWSSKMGTGEGFRYTLDSKTSDTAMESSDHARQFGFYVRCIRNS